MTDEEPMTVDDLIGELEDVKDEHGNIRLSTHGVFLSDTEVHDGILRLYFGGGTVEK